MFSWKHKGEERRKYIRLNSVFPVEFRLLSFDGGHFLSEWIQGFTNNISRGGMCLVANNLPFQIAELVKNEKVKLFLDIEIPLFKNKVSAQAKISWVSSPVKDPAKYLIGLAYEQIAPKENSKIFHYALWKKIIPRVIIAAILVLFLSFSFSSYSNLKLIRANKALIEQMVNILQKSSIAKQTIKELNRGKEEFNLKLAEAEMRIRNLQEEMGKKKTEELENLMRKLENEKIVLQEQLISLQKKESSVTESLLLLDKRRGELERVNVDKLYRWLKIHQNPRTGLIMSFEGDKDIANWAFIYDLSLTGQAYIYFNDFERARKIIDFFNNKAKKVKGGFLNAYYTDDGEPAEYTVHSGPNIWVGILALHYIKETEDKRYLGLAKEIAEWIIALQNQDKDGGIRGGPDVNWFATEHNLDAYAFFNMLFELTKEEKYKEASDKLLNWLRLHTYDRGDIPIIRGKGDSTIATDTYAWSVAAIGPAKLEELGMNPDKIIEFAETHCAVEVEYRRPEGTKVKVKGFDFTPAKNIARCGIVSPEWSAQMVLAYKIMAKFYHQKDMIAKARFYEQKADDYFSQITKLIISSPSPSGEGEGCLPYATQDFVDTGHGWMTPKGATTGSVTGTTYTIFAYYGYNPLEF